MAAATFINAICSGHGCFPPRKALEGSDNVFVNGKGMSRVGDAWETHCCTIICHDSIGVQGSEKVFINGRAAMRIGDAIECGSVVAQGSSKVFFG